MLVNLSLDNVKSAVVEGQKYFASGIKSMVQFVDKELFDLLDSDSDNIFLNPLLFAYLNTKSPKTTLRQILFADIEVEKRPSYLKVVSNLRGEIYLPNFAYFKIEASKKLNYTLITKKKKQKIYRDRLVMRHSKHNNPIIEETNIELQLIPVELVNPFIGNRMDSLKNVKDNEYYWTITRNINEAVAILKKYYPDFFDCLCLSTRWILPFESPDKNSFATMGVHGVGFLNTSDNRGVVFFIEDIVHQCGHVLFSNMTYRPQDYFLIDPETPLKELLSQHENNEDEDRTLYVAFHGVFTEALMCESFDYCIENKVFSGAQEHELKGRFTYILLRFILDMQNLDREGLFSEKGQVIYQALYKTMMEQYKKYQSLLKIYDLSNQPYNFSWHHFLINNPMHGITP